MKQYLELARHILDNGVEKKDRTGTGTLSVFGYQMRFNLQEGFPLVTTKKCHVRSIIHELLWFLKGETNTKYLTDNGVTIWNEWALKEDEVEQYPLSNADRVGWAVQNNAWEGGGSTLVAKLDHMGEEKGHEFLDGLGVPRHETFVKRRQGDLGPVYGKQWRSWDATTRRSMIAGQAESIDQIATVIDQLKNDPDSRRIIVSAWNVAELSQMALVPCFVGNTPISVPLGYKDIKEIKEGDLVLSDTCVPRKVLTKWITKYDGEILNIKTSYDVFPIECTPNHPFLTRTGEYVEAKELKEGDYLLIPRSKITNPYTFEYQKVINYNKAEKEVKYKTEKHTLTENDYFTLGYFLGNGWYMPNDDIISFSIPVTKIDKVLPIIRETIKVSPKKMESGTVNTYKTSSQKWANVFKDFGHKAHNKTIPEWVLSSPTECLSSFLNGYLEADGHLKSTGSYSCTTVSRSLAYGLQRLCVNLNKHSSITYQQRPETTVIEGRTVNQRNTFNVLITTRTIFKPIFDERGMWVPVQQIVTDKRKCEVYNLEVEEEHTYIARNIANHNCHCFFQFYTRELTRRERGDLVLNKLNGDPTLQKEFSTQCFPLISIDKLHDDMETLFDKFNIPERALSCQLYQRKHHCAF